MVRKAKKPPEQYYLVAKIDEVDVAYSASQNVGLHWCANFTCGNGSAVLIRAIEPRFGLAAMTGRRGLTSKRLLCSGPGRLCQALDINSQFDGLSLYQPPFCLTYSPQAQSVTRSKRIGVSLAKDTPRRFCAINSSYLSRPIEK